MPQKKNMAKGGALNKKNTKKTRAQQHGKASETEVAPQAATEKEAEQRSGAQVDELLSFTGDESPAEYMSRLMSAKALVMQGLAREASANKRARV
jgi:hypothetical protein